MDRDVWERLCSLAKAWAIATLLLGALAGGFVMHLLLRWILS